MAKEMLPFKRNAAISQEWSVKRRVLTGRGSITSLRSGPETWRL